MAWVSNGCFGSGHVSGLRGTLGIAEPLSAEPEHRCLLKLSYSLSCTDTILSGGD
jgi:hypothetical protein